jgi:hypothetical protein
MSSGAQPAARIRAMERGESQLRLKVEVMGERLHLRLEEFEIGKCHP